MRDGQHDTTVHDPRRLGALVHDEHACYGATSLAAQGDDLLQVGNAHFVAQRYAEAIAAYTKAIEAVPRDARAYKHRGLAHTKLGNAQQAYKDLSKAIE